MPFDTRDYDRYRWLRVLLGAIVVIAVVIAGVTLVIRFLTTWAVPGVVPIPSAPQISLKLHDHPRLIANDLTIESLAASKIPPSTSSS